MESERISSKENSSIEEKGVPGTPPAQTEILGHEVDADEALKAVSGLQDEIVLDEATNKRILRKIDLFMMPVSISSSAPIPRKEKRDRSY